MADATRTLTREDWAAAAFDALLAGGLGAVAVEPLAKRLGVSKGSFYWHFTNRDELVAAALDRWLAKTERIIEDASALPDPRGRLESVFDTVFADPGWQPLEVELLAHVAQPQVARAVARAAERRVGFMAGCLREIGLHEDRAADGALQAYALWTGLLHLKAAAPGIVPEGAAGQRFTAASLELLRTIYDRAGPTSPAPPADRGAR